MVREFITAMDRQTRTATWDSPMDTLSSHEAVSAAFFIMNSGGGATTSVVRRHTVSYLMEKIRAVNPDPLQMTSLLS